jgi:hypothetical protein
MDDVVVLFAGHGAHHALALQQADEEVVGVHVELLLLFALHVLGALRAKDVLSQPALFTSRFTILPAKRKLVSNWLSSPVA